ncbi:MAG: C10 family peptidase [Candidatus Cloacimonetes bacterium]|nr:C10 family peptidase [Candidatus Cloacimonadota bacterium]
MKRIVLFAIIALLIVSAWGETISQQTAQTLAEMHLRAHGKTTHNIASSYEMTSQNGTVVAHVFILAPAGYVIISTDTDIVPVVGYSFRNSFSTDDPTHNIGYLYVQADMQSRLDAIPLTDETIIAENHASWDRYLSGTVDFTNTEDGIWPPEGFSPTEGWIETEWNQSPDPWNTFCPIDPGNGGRTLTGCVATAMAQIMYYHRWCGNPNFNNSYDYISNSTNPYIYIDNDATTWDFPSFPTLNGYLQDLAITWAGGGTATDEMIGALNFAAGVSVEMNYSTEGSGAYSQDVRPALLNTFSYDSATYVSYTNSTFYNNLRTDMMEARPAYFGILANGGSGHAIICDGWNEADDTFHLNMGWGGSQNGWYSLPGGMPSGYNQISSAVINIEGGQVPFLMQGQVIASGAPLELTQLTLEGTHNYTFVIDNPNGNFETDFMYAGEYTYTAYIEVPDGGYYYKTGTATINETNNILIIFMDDYTHLDGTVSSPISVENTHINVYQDGAIVSSGVTDDTGVFSITGVMPGTYDAVASKEGNYFDAVTIDVTANNQTINFELEEYPHDHMLQFAGEPTEKFQFVPEMSVGIRFADDDIADFIGDACAKVNFIAPFNPDQGEIYAQLWHGEHLISEQQVMDFADGQWSSVVFDNVAVIASEEDYYVGYRIHSISGIQPAAWHDAGPNIPGKGGFIKTSGWIPLPATFDFNFCIQGIIVSQTPTGTGNTTTPSQPFSLGNNYPNPFNPTTTISYNLATDGNVSLQVFNTRGQLVKTLVNQHQTAGAHEITWMGNTNAGQKAGSGIYFYRIQTDNQSATRKMVLLK